jgi:hypothetical protein
MDTGAEYIFLCLNEHTAICEMRKINYLQVVSSTRTAI